MIIIKMSITVYLHWERDLHNFRNETQTKHNENYQNKNKL